MAKNRESGVVMRSVSSTEDLFAKWAEEEEREERERINNEIDSADSVDKLISRMFFNGINISEDLTLFDLDTAKVYVHEMVNMFNEFPDLKREMKEFGENISDDAPLTTAITWGDGRIGLNMRIMRLLSEADKEWQFDVSQGFHPAGTTAVHAISHEFGHLLEIALINKSYGKDQLVNAWRQRTVSTDVVQSALSRIPNGSEKSIVDISEYAAVNASETLAEAVADYRANGERAKPLSREIWRELKNRLK